MRISVIILLVGGSLTSALAFNLPQEATLDGDTIVLDETTTVSYGVPATESDVVEDVETRQESECKTTRGIRGTCLPVNECYPVLVPDGSNSSNPTPNPELAQILVEVSGFCAGGLEARSEITPLVFEQVMRKEVLLCCPSQRQTPPQKVKLDEPQKQSTNSEMYKARNCGYLKVDQSTLVNGTQKILKGRVAGIGEFPWMVALLNKGRQFCGGSLINERTVLTAAHCVQHMNRQDVQNLELRIGDHNLKQSGEVAHESRGASKVLYHKGFSMQHLMHDISLIHLKSPVAFKSNIQPVCLHSGNPGFEQGDKYADVTGWGALREGGGQPNDLRTVKVRVTTRQQCQDKYKDSANKVTEGMICAGSDNGEDSCQGDSGGPLTLESRSQAKLIGIVSWGVGCGRYPGVYTNVYKYLSWINTNQA